jgi:hypothetical protein
MRRAFAVTGLLALALLGGCSASSTPEAPAAAPTDAVLDEVLPEEPTVPEPCGLVTPDQAAEALGEPVEAGVDQPGGLPGQKSCGYGAIDSAKLVTISIIPGGADLWAQFKSASPNAEQITGVGDEAFRDAGLLQVLKGDLILSIFISGLGSGSDLKASLTSLAQAALAQL